jgi:hypothetical protein
MAQVLDLGFQAQLLLRAHAQFQLLLFQLLRALCSQALRSQAQLLRALLIRLTHLKFGYAFSRLDIWLQLKN